MIIGKPSVFAIEISLQNPVVQPWAFGKVCYWIAGEMFGDYDAGDTMCVIIQFLDGISSTFGKRHSEALCLHNKDLLFDRLREITLHDDPNNFCNTHGIANPSIFFASPTSESFDGFLSYLVECNEGDVLCYGPYEGGAPKFTVLPAGYFASIILDATSYLEKCGVPHAAV